MSTAHYIIHRVNLDLEAPDPATARRLQDEAVRLFSHWILPQLEELLERLVPKGLVLRLDSLNLELPNLEAANFDNAFVEELLQSFSTELERLVATATKLQETAADGKETAVAMVPEESRLAAFLAFLQTGRLPWWSSSEPDFLTDDALTEQLLTRPAALRRLTELLAVSDIALERLLLQFPAADIFRLIQLLCRELGYSKDENSIVTTFLQQAAGGRSTARSFWSGPQRQQLGSIIRLLIAPRTPIDRVQFEHLRRQLAEMVQSLRQRESGRPQPAPAPTPAQPAAARHGEKQDTKDPDMKKKNAEDEEGALYVDHAGLVLLHPFFEMFFREFTLLAGNDFQNDQARTLAVHLLQYLATGRENPPEYLLSFEKFLCGVDQLTPIARYLALDSAMHRESEKLLEAAIGHWRALKRTSPAGLREGFLQRPGKLVLSSFQNRLIVEGKSHDVLLNYLPWGYGIVKLPWLPQPLYVDWIN